VLQAVSRKKGNLQGEKEMGLQNGGKPAPVTWGGIQNEGQRGEQLKPKRQGDHM